MSYRVLIPTAGIGSRLDELTRYLNKSLITIANRPALAYLIDQFPEDAEFVIALGHKGELVREFLSLAYPQRTFFFATVDPFEGPGSGLGLSILMCKKFLQEPFVFCSCDTLVEESIPEPDSNWMGYAVTADLKPYRTLHLASGHVTEICEKGAEGPDLAAYIGLAGIKDYDIFWGAMEYGSDEAVRTGEAYGMNGLLLSCKNIQAKAFSWWDTGNKEALAKTKEKYRRPNAPNILDKPNEAIWFVNGSVIKFSADEAFIHNRVERASRLTGFCPPVTASTRHMYKYKEVDGEVLSKVITLPLFHRFLDHAAAFWQQHELNPDEQIAFRQTCLTFYRDKTQQRVQQFYRTFNRLDGTERINGILMPTLADLLAGLDWNWLAEGMPGRFHGDFHFENVLWSEKTDTLTFLDWRQDFGGSLTTGDIYYDLAKLLHGLIVCHELIAENHFFVDWTTNEIRHDLYRKQILVQCEQFYSDWLVANGYDRKKVWALTALIYLNIAALHHYPYCLMLYVLGKEMLYKELVADK